MLKEFRAFLLRGNLLELAVAFVIGAAFVKVVNALVQDLIQPIIAAIVSTPSFNDKTFHIGKGVFLYGAFITEVIVFVVTAAAVFFLIVKPSQIVLARIRRGDSDEAPIEPSEEVVLLTQIRDALAAQQQPRPAG
jgi:large conductance mechanosensitive channel